MRLLSLENYMPDFKIEGGSLNFCTFQLYSIFLPKNFRKENSQLNGGCSFSFFLSPPKRGRHLSAGDLVACLVIVWMSGIAEKSATGS